VIAITTYTEPVPLDAVVNDPLKNKENEETEERQSFSEILAGLLQKTQAPEPLASDPGLEMSAGQIESGNIELSAKTEEVDLEDSSDLELTQDFENMLLRADQLFTSSLDTEFTGENELALEIDGAEKLLPAEEMFLQIEPIIAETEQGDSTAQLAALDAAAKQNIGELAELSENRKKANTPVKTDGDETLSAKNKAGEGKETQVAKTDEGRDQPSRLEEFRNRARKDKVTVEVRDYRTNTGSDGTQTKTVSIIETAAGRSHAQTTVHEVTLDLRLPDQAQSQNTWEVKSSSSLENMLARELHQNFNGDIVRHASMALRDGGEGTIKLALHPETLGNVKIHLEMTENKITGRIVVESEEALNAFRKELTSLEQAFKDSGYANADLNLSLTGDGSEAQDRQFDENSFASRMAASFYEDGYDQESTPVINVALRRGSGLVNMFA
jgi:flagellar hook-length control protein FliK